MLWKEKGAQEGNQNVALKNECVTSGNNPFVFRGSTHATRLHSRVELIALTPSPDVSPPFPNEIPSHSTD